MLLPKVLPTRSALHGAVRHRPLTSGLSGRSLLLQRPMDDGGTPAATSPERWVNLGGVPVKLMEFDPAIQEILGRAGYRRTAPGSVLSQFGPHTSFRLREPVGGDPGTVPVPGVVDAYRRRPAGY